MINNRIAFPTRNIDNDFVEDLLRHALIKLLSWIIPKLGRNIINWSKPYLIEFFTSSELILHYFACLLKLESPIKFLSVYLRYHIHKDSS